MIGVFATCHKILRLDLLLKNFAEQLSRCNLDSEAILGVFYRKDFILKNSKSSKHAYIFVTFQHTYTYVENSALLTISKHIWQRILTHCIAMQLPFSHYFPLIWRHY